MSAKRFERNVAAVHAAFPPRITKVVTGFALLFLSTTNRPVYETLLRNRRDASTGGKLVLACRNFFRGNWRTESRRSSLESGGRRNFENRTKDNNPLPFSPHRYSLLRVQCLKSIFPHTYFRLRSHMFICFVSFRFVCLLVRLQTTLNPYDCGIGNEYTAALERVNEPDDNISRLILLVPDLG